MQFHLRIIKQELTSDYWQIYHTTQAETECPASLCCEGEEAENEVLLPRKAAEYSM